MSAPRKSSLAISHPKLASQADGWDPTDVATSSNKNMNWKCDFGHKWSARVSHRSKGVGCPICSNRQVLAGYNDLATTYPELAAQADGWDPTTVSFGHKSKKAWKCELGHKWEAAVSNRTGRNKTGCPICSNTKVLAGYNDLATINPALASQADGWDPQKIAHHARKILAWKCNLGHKWEAAVYSRADGNGCPICSNNKVQTGYNDLATTHPELAEEANGWDPTTVSFGSNKKVRWKCSFNHVWIAPTNNRVSGNNCPICSNRQVLAGYNDLATTDPEIASQADGWDPTIVTAGTHMKFDWKCNLGHKWEAAVYSRIAGNGCPICSGKAVLTGFNDLATTHPELAAQASGWDPATVSFGSDKKFAWECKLGHKWEAAVYNRANGIGCPYCSNKKVLVGYNDLATTHPEIASQADGWDPTTVSFGVGKKVKWVCEFNHTWYASPNSRFSHDTGCPSCAKFGFKPKENAWLYLLESEELELLQLGITNNPEERLAKHKGSGFEIIRDLRGPIDGYLARDLERSCIQSLVKRGAIFANKLGIKQFDGWTESWTTKSIAPLNFSELLEWVYSDESEVTTGSQNTQSE